VSPKLIKGISTELRQRIADHAFMHMSPFGKSLTQAMNGMRQDSISGYVLWEEECYCSPPLSMERTAVLDKYFAEIQIEQLSEEEGWARISDLPALSENIQKPCASRST
jgi:hypothetical protein